MQIIPGSSLVFSGKLVDNEWRCTNSMLHCTKVGRNRAKTFTASERSGTERERMENAVTIRERNGLDRRFAIVLGTTLAYVSHMGPSQRAQRD